LWCDSRKMSALAVGPVEQGRVACHAVLSFISISYAHQTWEIMVGNAYIPNDDRLWSPLDSGLYVLGERHMVIQEL